MTFNNICTAVQDLTRAYHLTVREHEHELQPTDQNTGPVRAVKCAARAAIALIGAPLYLANNVAGRFRTFEAPVEKKVPSSDFLSLVKEGVKYLDLEKVTCGLKGLDSSVESIEIVYALQSNNSRFIPEGVPARFIAESAAAKIDSALQAYLDNIKKLKKLIVKEVSEQLIPDLSGIVADYITG
jgi:hypothetical protein